MSNLLKTFEIRTLSNLNSNFVTSLVSTEIGNRWLSTGWVQYILNHPGQFTELSLAIPMWVGAVPGKSWQVNRHTKRGTSLWSCSVSWSLDEGYRKSSVPSCGHTWLGKRLVFTNWRVHTHQVEHVLRIYDELATYSINSAWPSLSG